MRKPYVDWIKAIGIFLVILSHANHANGVLKVWIYSFHMPLFFFASGLVMREYPLTVFFQKKLKSLILPYLLWGCIYASFSLENLVSLLYGSYHSIEEAGALTSLWFLPELFLGQMLTVSLRKWIPRDALRMGVCLALAVCGLLLPKPALGYPWCANMALPAAFFLTLGWVWEEKWSDLFARHNWLGPVLGVAGAAATLAAPLGFSGSGYVMMATGSVGRLPVFFLTALGGCLMVYGFSRCIRLAGPVQRAVQYISRNTLLIFAVHKPIVSGFEKLFVHFHLPWYLELALTGIGVLAGSCAAAAILNRFVPEFGGRSGGRNTN